MTMNGFDQRLSDVNVNIDRGGRVLVTFRGEHGREVAFTGQVTTREDGPLEMRCDVAGPPHARSHVHLGGRTRERQFDLVRRRRWTGPDAADLGSAVINPGT